jgi:NADH-quinone oxidoreductase subunit L
VIVAMHHEQDMRKMGGLRKLIPLTYWAMVIGTLALTGFPFTAGYYSKDAIIEAAHASHAGPALYGWVLTVLAAGLTSFYSWRLIFLTFHGTSRAPASILAHVKESPRVMLLPLAVLSAGALFAGMIFYGPFIGHEFEHFWRTALYLGPDNHIMHDMHETPLWIALLPTAMMLFGFAVAYWFYIVDPEVPVALARQNDVLYRFLLNKWYFDEIYDAIFVRPAKWLGRFLWKRGDGWLIDGYGPDGVSAVVLDVTNRVVRLQTGYVYHYAFAMLIGVAAFFTWFMFRG